MVKSNDEIAEMMLIGIKSAKDNFVNLPYLVI